MKIIPVTIIGEYFSKEIFALLDDGSAATVINSNVVREIGGLSTKIHVALKGIGGEGSLLLASEKIDLKIKTESAVFKIQMFELNLIINLPIY